MDGWKLQHVAWIDVETTGLDPEDDLLLEIALVITNADLVEITREVLVIAHSLAELDAAIDREDRCADQNLFIRGMHTDNGLLLDCQGLGDPIPMDLDSADDRLMEVLAAHAAPGQHRWPLGGCSTWIDQSMVRVNLPSVWTVMHNRTLDASGYKTALVNWAGVSPKRGEPKVYEHRALPDTLMAIRRAQAMRRFLLRASKAVEKKALAELAEALA